MVMVAVMMTADRNEGKSPLDRLLVPTAFGRHHVHTVLEHFDVYKGALNFTIWKQLVQLGPVTRVVSCMTSSLEE